ncbi:MAG: 1,4-dihydroxy-2-naphthoate polyprenyltransferase, partial [Pontimonas sp.]
MASLGLWVKGARLRTLPLALAPVVLGTGSAVLAGAFDLGLALLALVVALSLQIGVNYANDYSDGVRGTDDVRVGPARLTGSGAVEAHLVKRAAFMSFGVALLAGAIIILLSGLWWFVAIGAFAVVAAWLYTGGPKPYGYAGLGEVVVFVFFGLVATTGTAAIMIGEIPFEAWLTGSAAGFFAAAVLLVNNIRDIEQDTVAGKRTLAVRMGQKPATWLLIVLLLMPYAILAALSLMFFFAPVVFITSVLTGVIIVIVVAAKTPRELVT